MPGVSILVQGTTIATITNENGEFEINVPATEAESGKKAKLVISFIGSKTIVKDADADFSNVVLEDDVNEISEVVAVGYGTQEKADVTGSISTIKSKDLNFQPVTSYDQALQGKAAGLQILGASGQLGAEQRIRIRGVSSLSASNQPLIVMDGIILTQDDQTNFTGSNAFNPLSELNPNDIESVEVLKDAAAAAIYGARGSNGVIIITTKKGTKGATKFNANYATGFNTVSNLREFLNRDQYIQMFTAAAANDGYGTVDPVTGVPTVSDAGLNAAWSDYGGGPASGSGSFTNLRDRGANTDWNKSAYQTGRVSTYDFSAQGGSDKTTFFGSIGYRDEEGIVLRNSMNRLNGRFNIDHQVNKMIRFGLATNIAYNNRFNAPENNQFNSPQQANALAPIIPFYDGKGDYNDSTFYANPVRAMWNSKATTSTFRAINNIYASWEIIKGLTFKSEFGSDMYHLTEFGYNNSKFPVSAGTPSQGEYGTSKVYNYSTNNTLTYNKTFAEKHNIVALLGTSYQDVFSEYSSIQGQGSPSDNLEYLNAASTNLSFSSSAAAYTFISYFGRINYKYSNKYLLGVSLRNDASSRFGRDTRSGYFPAVSAGYIITEENFVKDLGISNILNFFKIKGSFGMTGNAEIGNYLNRGLYSPINNGPRAGLIPGQISNPILTWEKGEQYDVGVEYGFFQNRISGGVDLYWKNTSGMLLALPIPPTSGFTSSQRNVGAMKTNGWDVYVNTKNLTGALKWETSFNISGFKNEITDMSGSEILATGRTLNAAIVGQPLGVFYGVEYAGVDPATGNALYRLADGSTTTSWTTANQRQNLKVLGNPNPDFYGGITNEFKFKGIDFSFQFYGTYGNDIHLSSGTFQSSGFTNFGLDNQTVDQLNYWTPANTNTNIPAPVLGRNNGARTSSRYISDGSYLRLRNLTLGYTLPKSLVEKLKLEKVRVYFTSQNLLTFTNYKGNDPETNYYTPSATTTNANLANGVDYYSAPQIRSFMFGINVGF